MANLRTNNLSGEQGQNAYRGSVLLESASSSRISVTNTTGLDFGTDQFTIEFWIYLLKEPPVNKNIFARSTSASNTTGMIMWFDGNGHLEFDSIHGVSGAVHTGAAIGNHMWHHIAVTRDSSNNTRLYLNGVNKASASSDTSNIVGATNLQIASNIGADAYYNDAYISNFRMVKGTAIYSGTTDFTPPQSELTVVDGTILLCCQDSNDPTQEATDKTVTGFGNLATAGYLGTQPKVIPPVGRDAGNAFGGPIQQSSQGYMYFPTGRTEERGGTRACWFRGYTQAGANINTIDFSEMSSKGNAIDFGDTLTSNRQAGALGSSTRGVFGGRDGTSNVIEFITFSTQSNSLDFGDFTAARGAGPATMSDGTRGIFAGGYVPTISEANVIEFITIASLGNGTDFGDLTDKGSEPAGCASPTRGVRMGGRLTGNNSTNVIDFFTIQSAGNATNFGDLTVGRSEAGGASSDTRGVCIAGYNYPGGGQNVIDFITIASEGNATDFGDIASYTQSWQGGAGSNNVIIAHGIGYNGSARDNRIDFITIASTGNSVDYGDLTNQRSQIPCATNGHGGLS